MPIALYAGSFDPPTEGHLSVVRAAAAMFERLVAVVAVNPEKQPLFSGEERVSLLQQCVADLPHVSVAFTTGYVVHLARLHGATVLVRGVRGAVDAEVETKLAQLNASLAPEIQTVFVPAEARFHEVSSSRLKAMARAGESLAGLCPPHVEAALKARVEQEAVIQAAGGAR